jgi:hypothetical protein
MILGRHHKEKIIICGILLPDYYEQMNALPQNRSIHSILTLNPKINPKGLGLIFNLGLVRV